MDRFTSINARPQTRLWFTRLKGQYAEREGRTVENDEFLNVLLGLAEAHLGCDREDLNE